MAEKVSQVRLEETRGGVRPTVGPQSIGVILTNACNLNCITCWSYSSLRKKRPPAEWMRRHLTHALLRPFFEQVASIGTERVVFTGGGDPLAHPEFCEIAASAHSAGLKVTLISNLTLVRDLDSFLSLELDTILVNFSCGDAETYVAFHPNRKEADFYRLIGMLERLAATRTTLKLVFVVCSMNAHVLAELLTIAGRLRASVQLKLMSVTPHTAPLAIGEDQRQAILEQLPLLRRQADENGVAVNFDVFHAELSGTSVTQFPIEETGCYAGHYYSRVTASGDVYFCCNQHPSLRIGSLYETDFLTLWASDRYQSARQRLREGRYVPGCQQCGKFDMNRKVARELRIL